MEQEKRLDREVEVRLEIAKLAPSVGINNIPALHAYVMEGDLGRIYARQKTRLLQAAKEVKARSITTMEEEAFYIELAKLLQHYFADNEVSVDVWNKLVEEMKM